MDWLVSVLASGFSVTTLLMTIRAALHESLFGMFVFSMAFGVSLVTAIVAVSQILETV